VREHVVPAPVAGQAPRYRIVGHVPASRTGASNKTLSGLASHQAGKDCVG
jgi:hypothetical protein